MSVHVQINLKEDSIEIDNGHQYLTLTLEEAKLVVDHINDALFSKQVDENLKKNWNYLGGL